ncbi:MAG: MBL fold metallo-hydrolase [Patescibacteria group bacterium]|nr:MBL fold metallo-hydrolase [Patescibacteria group bacterium]
MILKILYNNRAKEGFKEGWGFSCLIESIKENKKILFDTGADFETLSFNAQKLGVNFKNIDKVVISHDHDDHTGGLAGVLKENNKVKVIWPKNENSFRIISGIFSTGSLKAAIDLKEQSLFLATKKGLVIIVGCSHPGVDKILQRVKEVRSLKNNKKIYAIIGGFHGFNKLDELEGIEVIGACHCTSHKQEIKKKFPDQFKKIRAGDIIKL